MGKGKHKMSAWNRFLKQEHAAMKRSSPDGDVSLGAAMKAASPKWKKMNKTKKNQNRMQGGSELQMSSLDGAPAEVGAGSSFAGGRRRRKSSGTRKRR